MKKTLLAHNLFPLNTGNWYLGWWLDTGAKLPEFHSQVYSEHRDAVAKLDQLKSKYSLAESLRQAEEQRIADSWRANPDRSGGQFTQDEINNSGRWI
jgi:hypothetical protein